MVRVHAVLDASRPSTVADVVLAALAAACGLGSRVLRYEAPGSRRRLDQAVLRLGPDLRELVAQTQAVIDGALLSQRM
jgi:hypothetical protein